MLSLTYDHWPNRLTRVTVLDRRRRPLTMRILQGLRSLLFCFVSYKLLIQNCLICSFIAGRSHKMFIAPTPTLPSYGRSVSSASDHMESVSRLVEKSSQSRLHVILYYEGRGRRRKQVKPPSPRRPLFSFSPQNLCRERWVRVFPSPSHRRTLLQCHYSPLLFQEESSLLAVIWRFQLVSWRILNLHLTDIACLGRGPKL